ncbi:MAG: hypothetical protein WA628_05295 [Terriglobales bacterium]
MRRVALTSDQVRALADTYADAVASGQFPTEWDPANPQRAFLPPDLLRSDGPWICLTGYSAEPVAIGHFSGRSRFLVFLRLPGGRQATIEYLGKLLESPQPLFVEVQEGEAPTLQKLNLRLPQFTVGTEVALLRQMIVIDAEGNLEPTALTESVQLRVYHAVTSGSAYINYENGPSSHDQNFFEFRFNRAALFARHGGGLQAVRPGETEFSTFSSFGIDPFEASRKNAWVGQPSEILARCRACHVDAGIHSVQSRERWLGQPPRSREGEAEPSLSRAVKWETERTVERKQRRDDFKSLLRCWRSPE